MIMNMKTHMDTDTETDMDKKACTLTLSWTGKVMLTSSEFQGDKRLRNKQEWGVNSRQ
jgi:hypothetical protein